VECRSTKASYGNSISRKVAAGIELFSNAASVNAFLTAFDSACNIKHTAPSVSDRNALGEAAIWTQPHPSQQLKD
jgi:hypothetical protein